MVKFFKKNKLDTGDIILVIALVLVAGFIGANFFSVNLNGSFERFDINLDKEVRTSEISSNLHNGVCQKEFKIKFPQESATCYIDDYFLSSIFFHNGDGVESFQDQDRLTIKQIRCICSK